MASPPKRSPDSAPVTELDPYRQSLDCVHCGLCLPVCPTYKENGRESSSPRGRIYLMRAMLERRLAPSDSVFRDLDQCLVCRACETACPAGVHYGDLIASMRDRMEVLPQRRTKIRFWKRFFFRHVLPYQRRLALASSILSVWQRFDLRRVIRWTGLLRLVPKAMLDQEPDVPVASKRRSPPPVTPARGGKPKARLGLLVGCAAHQVAPGATWSALRVLSLNEFEVQCPNEQPCCGALAMHFGDLESARRQARRTIDAFERVLVDNVLVTAAGCGSAMKEYGILLAGDPDYKERAQAFSSRVKDITEYLASDEIEAPDLPVPLKVVYDDPCHLIHGQGIADPPRQLLRQIPSLELIETGEGADCCGAAGIYNVLQSEMAQSILDRKIGAIQKKGADLIATANPGCLLHLKNGMRARGIDKEILHPIELLDRAYSDSRD